MNNDTQPEELLQDLASEPAAETAEQAAEAAEPSSGVVETPPPAAETDPLRDMQDQLLRLRADFENFRKRTRREKEEWTVRSLENICGDLLSVLDSFELGLKNAEEHAVAPEIVKGFALVQGQLLSVLGKYGLTALSGDAGVFDPNEQEAIAHVPSAEVPAGGVVAVTRRGYTLGGRLLRPGQVVVSQGAPETADTLAEEG